MFTLASSIETTALRTSMTDLGLTEQVSQNCFTARLSGLAFGWIRTSLRFDSRVLIGRRASANRLSKSVKLSRSTMEHSASCLLKTFFEVAFVAIESQLTALPRFIFDLQ